MNNPAIDEPVTPLTPKLGGAGGDQDGGSWRSKSALKATAIAISPGEIE